MITVEEKSELARLSREDGKRFYGVVEGLYKFLIAVNWVTGVVGALVGIGLIISGMGGNFTTEMVVLGVVIFVVTGFVCAANYAVAVLTTHGAKILVHILFSNLAIMEAGQS